MTDEQLKKLKNFVLEMAKQLNELEACVNKLRADLHRLETEHNKLEIGHVNLERVITGTTDGSTKPGRVKEQIR
jgi:hypothetical protein